jgi:hypothetical protein
LLCVLYSKGRKAKPGQSGQESTDKLHRKKNPVDGMYVYFLWVLCAVKQKSLRRADPSSRGVLPTVVCHWVWSRNFKNEAALARLGLTAPYRISFRQFKKIKTTLRERFNGLYDVARRWILCSLFLLWWASRSVLCRGK